MNRLTIRNSDGTVSQPVTTSIHDVFLKLAMYENTGLEPNEIVDLMNGSDGIKTGEWITFKDEDGKTKKKCSVCEAQVSRSVKYTNYCGNCGSKMLD